MAAYTDNHHSFCNHLPLSSGLTSGNQHHSQEVSISELVNHGSISFGRFAPESLAWEKWSVFSHNRCQEELEKFKAPGLVAQKKAYFEEYYKKIRAMKKLQAEQQETEKLELSLDEDNIPRIETSIETTKPEEENNYYDTIQTYSSEDEGIQTTEELGQINGNVISRNESKTSSATVVDEEQDQYPNDDMIDTNETRTFSATIVDGKQGQTTNSLIINSDETETSSATVMDKVKQVPVAPIKTCTASSLQNGFESSTVKLNASRARDPAALSKAKATVNSARDKTKLVCRTKKDAIIRSSEKQNLSVDNDLSGKSTSQVLSARENPKLSKNPKSDHVSSHRPHTKIRSSAALSETSVIKDRPTSSHSVRSMPKANLNSPLVTKERPRSSQGVRNGVMRANLGSASVLKERTTSSSGVKKDMPRAYLNSHSVTRERPASSSGVKKDVPRAYLNSHSVTRERPASSSGIKKDVPRANLNSHSVTRERPTSSYGVRNGVPKANLSSPSVVRDRPTSSYSVRSGASKANLNSTSVLKDWPTSSSSVRTNVPKAIMNSTSVLKGWPASSSSVRTGVPKANLNSEISTNKTTLKPKTIINGVDNLGPGKRGHAGDVGKSMEPSSCVMMPKRGPPENQKLKVGPSNSPGRTKLKQNVGGESVLKNDSSRGNKTKILPWQSADMTHTRRELRPKTPSWR